MGSIIDLLDLYLEKSTDELLSLLDRDNDSDFLNTRWRHALMEEIYNRTIPKLSIKDGTGNNVPLEELPKVKIKTNRGRMK